MPTILIFRTSGIGDVILSTVALNIIKANVPEAEVIWVGRIPTLSLIKEFYPTVKVFNLSKDRSNLQNFRLLKRSLTQLDLIIDLQKSGRTILLGRLLQSAFPSSKFITWNKFSLERALFVLQAHLRGRYGSMDLFHKQLQTRVDAMASCTKRALSKLGVEVNNSYARYRPEFIIRKDLANNIAICLGSLYRLKELDFERLNEILACPSSLVAPE